MQKFDLQLSLDIDLVIVFGLAPVNILLRVLPHHDEVRGIGGLK